MVKEGIPLVVSMDTKVNQRTVCIYEINLFIKYMKATPVARIKDNIIYWVPFSNFIKKTAYKHFLIPIQFLHTYDQKS